MLQTICMYVTLVNLFVLNEYWVLQIQARMHWNYHFGLKHPILDVPSLSKHLSILEQPATLPI